MCSNLGFCPNIDDCTYAHSLDELRINPSYKTKICRFILTKGSCPHGDNCHYAHGEHEVRVHPNYKTAPCYYYQSSGKCPSGAACVYYHTQSEMRKPGEGERKTSDALDKIDDRIKESTKGGDVIERTVENKMTPHSLGTITDTRFLNYDEWCSFQSWVSTPAEERLRALGQSGAGGEIYYSDSEDEEEMRRQCWR